MAGPWEKYGGQSSGGSIVSLPPTAEQVEAAKRAADSNARAEAARQDAHDLAVIKTQIEQERLRLIREKTASPNGKAPDAKTLAKIANLDALVGQINRVEELYRENIAPEPSGVLSSIGDYLPTPENRQFDSAAAGLAEQGLAAFRVPGVGAQSDTELRQFVQANKPSASDYDVSIEEKLRQLRARVEATRSSMGLPPAEWTPPNPLTQAGGDVAVERATGATGIRPDNLAFTNQLNALYRSGASAEELAEFSARNGRAPSPQHMQGIREMVEYRDSGKGMGRFTPEEENRSALEQGAGAALSNPLGAGIAGATNMLGGGMLEGFAPDQYQMLRDEGGMTGAGLALGEIGGAVGATSALGKIGGNIASRIAPRLLQGGRGAQFGRNLASDASLGAAYGANTAGDPLSGAGLAAVGSAGGQVVGKGIGIGLGGLTRQADASFLNSRGVPTTVGQDLGGFAKSLEDATTSIPGVGDLVNARHLEGMRGFNQVPFNQVGAQLGVNPTAIGREGLDQLKAGINPTYDAATAGVRVGFDPQFAAEYAAAQAAGSALPDDLSSKFGRAMQNRVDPILAPPRPDVSLRADGRKLRIDEGGNEVGFLLRQPGNNGEQLPFVGISGVDPAQRGRGIGSAAYDELAKQVPDLVPSPLGLSESATALWRRRIAQMSRSDAEDALRRSEGYGTELGETSADIRSRLAPLWDAIDNPPPRKFGQMTGEQYQQAMRGIKGYRAEHNKPGFEQDYRDALTLTMDALKGNMTRQGGESVVTGLAKADKAYREFKTLKDAVEHSGGGTVAGDVGLVAPSQLGRAAQKTADKFGGDRPFGDLIDAGQRVLPSKVPDSGTAKRLMTGALAGGAGLGGLAGIGAIGPGDPGSNALGGFSILAALALANTSTGQKALKKALIDRPGPIKAAGAKVRKRAGLFGSASVPLLLEGSQ